MDEMTALTALSALAHSTRLDIFRRLVSAEPHGLSTGSLVTALKLSQSTLSTHLAVLVAASLVVSERRGRQMIQRAEIERLRALMVFLARDCCQGRADLCAPLVAELADCG